MSETRKFPFGGVPVYNPQSLSKSEAIAQFHARQAVYQSLLDLLRQERPSHVLIIGTRGMGKTTLLQRVRYGVEEESDLQARYLPLVFPEEQYNVNRLDRFYLNMVDALADAQERLGNTTVLSKVEAFANEVSKLAREEIEVRVPRFLEEISKLTGRNLLLLVDNSERLFETIEDKEQWRFRELLSARPDLTFIGATTQASDGIYGPNRAFFEFFQIYTLAPLTLDEVRSLLLRLSESVEDAEGQAGQAKRRMEEWLAADAGRLRTLVHLTGGNPRTTVLLFHLVLDGLTGGAREYLEQLLDQCTPNYKGRVDELPPQAQQVLDAVALRWDPVTASEVAEDTRLETNAVSTQLTRLVRQGILEKADAGDSKKALYQVAERFFNIWYLMRASRRVRAKLRWFVEFLRVFFDANELEAMAVQEFGRVQDGGTPRCGENAAAFAWASGRGRRRYEEYLRKEFSEAEQSWSRYLDLIPSDASANESMLVPDTAPPTRGGSTPATQPDAADTEESVRSLLEVDPKSPGLWARLGNLLEKTPAKRESAEAAYRRAIELDPKGARTWLTLGLLLAREPDRKQEAESAYRQAIELDPEFALPWLAHGHLLSGEPDRRQEAEAAYNQAIKLDPEFALPWVTLGHLLSSEPDRKQEAEAAYRKAIDLDPQEARTWIDFGNLLSSEPDRKREAEAAYRKAIDLDPQDARPWNNLGNLLSDEPDRNHEAEAAYRQAIELDPEFNWPWASLGHLLSSEQDRQKEAEAACRQAIELKPKLALPWVILGDLLSRAEDRQQEAEAAYRQAIELDPQDRQPWASLGHLLSSEQDRQKEAEAAYRQAIELDPRDAAPWNNLGNILSREPDRKREAEAAYRQAIDLDPQDARPWNNLGNLLSKEPDRKREAEAAYRQAIELDPQSAAHWNHLGNLLSDEPDRKHEAEAAYRQAIELDPEFSWPWASLGDLLSGEPDRKQEAEASYRKAIEIDPLDAQRWNALGDLLSSESDRKHEAEAAYRHAIELDPESAYTWGNLGVHLACHLRMAHEAEPALRRAVELEPLDHRSRQNLGVLLFCELGQPAEARLLLQEAARRAPANPVTQAILAAMQLDLEGNIEPKWPDDGAPDTPTFWHELLTLVRNYRPFGKILVRICDLVERRDRSHPFTRLWRALALAQLADFPRASVALEDALVGDPIDLLARGRSALEVFFAAAVEAGRVRECIDVLEKKEWIDTWRPIYEALKAVEAGSAAYLKRVAVEIREPALLILQRIAPTLAK